MDSCQHFKKTLIQNNAKNYNRTQQAKNNVVQSLKNIELDAANKNAKQTLEQQEEKMKQLNTVSEQEYIYLK